MGELSWEESELSANPSPAVTCFWDTPTGTTTSSWTERPLSHCQEPFLPVQFFLWELGAVDRQTLGPDSESIWAVCLLDQFSSCVSQRCPSCCAISSVCWTLSAELCLAATVWLAHPDSTQRAVTRPAQWFQTEMFGSQHCSSLAWLCFDFCKRLLF